MEDQLSSLIYDWNLHGESQPARPAKRVEFDDETLRDGLQSPSVSDPSLDDKIRILHFMERVGIDTADIGLPGAGLHVQKTVERLAIEIRDNKMKIVPNCAGRTHEKDIRPIAEISQRVGIPIAVAAFIGSSPIRQFAEEWDLDWIIDQATQAIRFAVSEGLPVMFVTEDTVRAKPEHVEKLYTAAIEAGAERICLCDTVGHATPWGTTNLVRFARHIGERVGNTALDLLMVNLKLMGWIDNDLTALPEYVRFVSEVTHVPLVDQYPVFGRDAFRTGTGVHAAAIIKAKKKGSEWLADRVYSGVPAHLFGLEQIIEVGPMSGLSNVIYWLAEHEYPADEDLTKEIFAKVNAPSRMLTDQQLHDTVAHWALRRLKAQTSEQRAAPVV